MDYLIRKIRAELALLGLNVSEATTAAFPRSFVTGWNLLFRKLRLVLPVNSTPILIPYQTGKCQDLHCDI